MTVYFLVLPNARCRLMGSSTFSAPCALWPCHAAQTGLFPTPVYPHLQCGLDEALPTAHNAVSSSAAWRALRTLKRLCGPPTCAHSPSGY